MHIIYMSRKSFFYAIFPSIFLLFFSYSILLNSSTLPHPFLILMLPSVLPKSPPNKIQKFSTCNEKPLIKVYMYDLPRKFHFGLLNWNSPHSKNETWPEITSINSIPRYPRGLNLQHSVEYWLTLDLLSSKSCVARRVKNSSIADIIFVPFFSSLSYNRNSKKKDKALQDELVRFLKGREEWRRWGGRDHLVIAHHPNSLMDARKEMGNPMFVVADFGRFEEGIANVEKDVVAPYVHVVGSIGEEELAFDDRRILVYFQGAIYRKDSGLIRQELYQLLKHEKDVHFSYGSARKNGIMQASLGMSSSKFCLNIAGDTPSSNRLFDAIASHCVPVIISDDIELPFEDILDYSEFSVFVRATNAVKEGYLMNLLRGITSNEWMRMWKKLKDVEKHFEYQYPSREDDAVQMIWMAVERKLSRIRMKINKEKRFLRKNVQ